MDDERFPEHPDARGLSARPGIAVDADLQLGLGPAEVTVRGRDSRLQVTARRWRDVPVLWKERRRVIFLGRLSRRFDLALEFRVGQVRIPRWVVPV